MKLLIALVLSGCSAAGVEADPVFVNPDLVPVEIPYDADDRGTTPCGYAVDPDIALYDFVLDASDRWFNAVGCLIEIDPDGIPVHIQDHVFLDESGGVYDVDPQLQYKETCGATRYHNDGSPKDIYISWTDHGGCRVTETTVHELGHVWSPPHQHSESGVMAAGKDPDRSPLIDENTLAWTCQRLECQTFNPEL